MPVAARSWAMCCAILDAVFHSKASKDASNVSSLASSLAKAVSFDN